MMFQYCTDPGGERLTMKKSMQNKILNAYYNLNFPSSYGGIRAFRESLKDRLGIQVSYNALRRLLKNSLFYQTEFQKKSKPPHSRALYSAGVGLEGTKY